MDLGSFGAVTFVFHRGFFRGRGDRSGKDLDTVGDPQGGKGGDSRRTSVIAATSASTDWLCTEKTLSYSAGSSHWPP